MKSFMCDVEKNFFFKTYSFARASLSTGHEITPCSDYGYGILLNWCGSSIITVLDVGTCGLKEITFFKSTDVLGRISTCGLTIKIELCILNSHLSPLQECHRTSQS